MSLSSSDRSQVSRFAQWLARGIFRLTGWRAEGSVPAVPRFVIIAAPHTSNWDGFIMVTAAYIFGVRISWFLKQEAFRGPLAPILSFFGAVPIDRSARRNVVGAAVEQFRAREYLILAVSPEGTRSKVDGWKTGFYRIAHGARVPIVLGYIDYARKVAGLGPAFVPTGDIDADFRVFESFYAGVTPKYPAERGKVISTENADRTA